MSSGCKDSNRQQQHSQTARQFLHWFIHNSNPFSLFLVWTFLCITNTNTHSHTHRRTKAKAQAPMGLRLQAVQLLVLLGLVCSASVQAWVNDFRQPLDYSCSSGGFRLLESYHSDRKSEYFSPPFPLREREEQPQSHTHIHTRTPIACCKQLIAAGTLRVGHLAPPDLAQHRSMRTSTTATKCSASNALQTNVRS